MLGIPDPAARQIKHTTYNAVYIDIGIDLGEKYEETVGFACCLQTDWRRKRTSARVFAFGFIIIIIIYHQHITQFIVNNNRRSYILSWSSNDISYFFANPPTMRDVLYIMRYTVMTAITKNIILQCAGGKYTRR